MNANQKSNAITEPSTVSTQTSSEITSVHPQTFLVLRSHVSGPEIDILGSGSSLCAARKVAEIYMLGTKRPFKPMTGWPEQTAWISSSQAIYIGIDPRQPGWKGVRRNDLVNLTKAPGVTLRALVEAEVKNRNAALTLLHEIQSENGSKFAMSPVAA